jgi:hypothetical protein
MTTQEREREREGVGIGGGFSASLHFRVQRVREALVLLNTMILSF